MNKTDLKRQQIIAQIVDHLLAHGMQATSVRQLATAADLSDRMLLHYFDDKDAVMRAALQVIAERLVGMLAHIRAEPRPFALLIPQLVPLLDQPDIRPFLRIWLELAALATQEGGMYRDVAQSIGEAFRDWLATALLVRDEAERRPLAALALATIEGLVLLDAIGCAALIPEAVGALQF